MNTSKHDKSKVKLAKGNQITTYQQEPTSWIEATENELPGIIPQQNVLKVCEYTQVDSNNITIVEESILQETSISSSSAQTEYIIDKHKYSKEAIKPYFLNYFDLEENCSPDSTDSIKNYLIGEDIFQKICEKFNNGTNKVDTETGITPKQSSLTCITDYLKSVTDRARKESNEIIFERGIVDPLFKSENINVYPLSCETLKPTILSTGSHIKDLVIISDFDIAAFSAESVKKLVLAQVDCEEDQMSKFDELSSTPSSCPPPVEVCHKCGSDSCSEEVHIMCRKGDVQFKLKCKRLGGGSQGKSDPKIGEEVKYECEVVLDNGECIDSSILESRDLKCELVDNPGGAFYPQNIRHDVRAADIDPNPTHPPFSPRCDIGPCPPHGGLCAPCPPCPPCPPCEKKSSEKEDIKKEDTKKECKKKKDNKFKIIIKAKESDNSDKSICPEDGANQSIDKCPKEKLIFACRSNTSNKSKHSESEEDKSVNKCPKEKLIFACRSKTKIKPQEMVEDKVESKKKDICTQGNELLKELTTAMLHAHCKTVATIKEAAQDVYSNVDKALCKPKKETNILEDAKSSAEKFICDMQKKANDPKFQEQIHQSVENIQQSVGEVRKSACQVMKKASAQTRAAVDEATKQGKKLLGIKKSKKGECDDDDDDDEEECAPPKLPKMPKPKKTSYPNDDNDSDLAEVVKKTAEIVYHTVCKTTQEAKDAMTELASHSMKVIGLDTDEPPNRVTSPRPTNVEDSKDNKYSAENVANEGRNNTKEKQMSALERLEAVKNSAEQIIDTVVTTTQTIKERTEEAVTEIATGTKNIYSKKDNIKAVLSGFKLFNKDEEENEVIEAKNRVEDEEAIKNYPVDSSLFGVLQHGFENLTSFEDESSPYDKPKPRDVAMLPETSSSKGMFTKIKEKFISMFYDRESKQSLSSDSSEENSENANKQYLFDRFLD